MGELVPHCIIIFGAVAIGVIALGVVVLVAEAYPKPEADTEYAPNDGADDFSVRGWDRHSNHFLSFGVLPLSVLVL